MRLKYSKYDGTSQHWDSLEHHLHDGAYCSKECDCEELWCLVNPRSIQIKKIYEDQEDSPYVKYFDCMFVCWKCYRFFFLKKAYSLSDESIVECPSCSELCIVEEDDEKNPFQECSDCVEEERLEEEKRIQAEIKEAEDFSNFLNTPEDIVNK